MTPNDRSLDALSADRQAGQPAETPLRTPRPSIGRIVHYVAYGTPRGEFPAGVCRAAVITEVEGEGMGGVVDAVGLCVLNPTGLFFNRGVPYDEEHAPGSWHWPERV